MQLVLKGQQDLKVLRATLAQQVLRDQQGQRVQQALQVQLGPQAQPLNMLGVAPAYALKTLMELGVVIRTW